MLDKLKAKFMGTKKVEEEKSVEEEQPKVLIPLEEVNMSNYIMNDKLAKKIAPLNNMWTFSMEEDSGWDNDLYYTKENAIARGSSKAKQLGLKKFYIARTVQNGLPIGSNALDILFQLKDSIANLTQGQKSDYVSMVNEKDVFELEDSLQSVVFDWLKKNNFAENFYLLDSDSIQEASINSSAFNPTLKNVNKE